MRRDEEGETLILSVDIALRKSGWVLLSDNHTILEHGIITVPPKLQYTEASMFVYEKFLELFLRVKKGYPDDIQLVVEDVADFFHKVSALGIHAARTAAILAWKHAHHSNLNVSYYTPSSVKYFLTNKRGADKELVLSGIKEKYPQYDYSQLAEDEVDALGLALLHIHRGENNEPVSKTKQRRVSKGPRR